MTIDCMYYLIPITTSAMHSGAVGGKTGKTAVLPRFCKIGRGGGSGGAPPYYGGLSWPVRARRAGGAAVNDGCIERT